MYEDLIVRHCSPTLAGLKTGNIFSCHYLSEESFLDVLKNINDRLYGKGIRVIPLRLDGKKALVYVYRPKKLIKDFSNQVAGELLKSFGYCEVTENFCIMRLIERLNESGEFPHEIGLFLGYPPEDVKGFIEQGPSCCKCCGNWKVYGNIEEAQKTFEKYKKCTESYCMLWKKLKSIERLTVAV